MTQLDSLLRSLAPVSLTKTEQFEAHSLQSLVLHETRILAKQRNRVET